jgi:hypothetical protein
MVPEEYSATFLSRLPQVDEAGGCAHVSHAHLINDQSDLKMFMLTAVNLISAVCVANIYLDLWKNTTYMCMSNSGVDSDFIWLIAISNVSNAA